MSLRRRVGRYLAAVLLIGCAGTQRECASCNAEEFGADWVVVQVDAFGHPYRCWELHDTSIDNERESDGIYWRAPEGHLVHIAGQYNRVQVHAGNWDQALADLGLTRTQCEQIHHRSADPANGQAP